jgi:hypothetical protein
MDKETRKMIEGFLEATLWGIGIVFVILVLSVAWMVYDMTSK